MAGDEQLSQEEIEKLLQSANRQPSGGHAGPSGGIAGNSADDASRPLSQDEIEKLLQQAGRTPATPSPAAKAAPAAGAASESPEAQIHPADLDYLFRQAEQALASLESDQVGNLPPGLSPFEFTEFSGAPPSTQAATLDLLKEVELDVQIELGRTRLYLEDVLRLRKGAVVTLDKLAGDPVDIYVNGRLIARGEVLVLNDNFCIRVAELVAGRQPQVEGES
ncbi:flagellar motor switch protein FliN [Thermogutta sp.]|uniref:flagellar motor switch protein FliN n=1 Tax=Thermogutta sp. TaxID=1962930 RepID=UPI0032203568